MTVNLNTSRYQRIIDALGERGARTGHLARRIGASTATMRRRLGVLEAAGKVRRDERFTYVNDIYWQRADARP